MRMSIITLKTTKLSSLTGERDEIETADIIVYSKAILDKYVFEIDYLKPWINEGIAPTTLTKYNIKYDMIENAIVVPYYTIEKDLVGVRGRFLSEDARAKYMPMKHEGSYLSHPTSRVLYGLDVNKEAIEETKTVILFEGEKALWKWIQYMVQII